MLAAYAFWVSFDQRASTKPAVASAWTCCIAGRIGVRVFLRSRAIIFWPVSIAA
jgi:hypothetical protein